MKKFICLFFVLFAFLSNPIKSAYPDFLAAVDAFENPNFVAPVGNLEVPHFESATDLLLDLLGKGNLHGCGHLKFLYENRLMTRSQSQVFQDSPYHKIILTGGHDVLDADFVVSQVLMSFKYALNRDNPLYIQENDIFSKLLEAANEYNCGRAWFWIHEFFTKDQLFDKSTKSVKGQIAVKIGGEPRNKDTLTRFLASTKANLLFFGYLHLDSVDIFSSAVSADGFEDAFARMGDSNPLKLHMRVSMELIKLTDEFSNLNIWRTVGEKLKLEGGLYPSQLTRNSAMLGNVDDQRMLSGIETRKKIKPVWPDIVDCREIVRKLVDEGANLEQKANSIEDKKKKIKGYQEAYTKFIMAKNRLEQGLEQVDPDAHATLYLNLAAMLVHKSHLLKNVNDPFSQAISYIERAEKRLPELEEIDIATYNDTICRINFFRGMAFYNQQRYEDAFENFKEAYSLGNKEGINYLMNIIIYKHQRGDRIYYSEKEFDDWSEVYIENDLSNLQHLAVFWTSQNHLKGYLDKAFSYLSLYLNQNHKNVKNSRKNKKSLNKISPGTLLEITNRLFYNYSDLNLAQQTLFENLIKDVRKKCPVEGALTLLMYNTVTNNFPQMIKDADTVFQLELNISFATILSLTSAEFMERFQLSNSLLKKELIEIINSLGYEHMKKQDLENDQIAVSLLKKAAKLGNYYAMYNLSILYRQGRGGLESSLDKAIQCLRLALPSGDPDILNDLGCFLFQQSSIEEEAEKTELFEESQNYLQAAYEEGSKFAAVNAFLYQIYHDPKKIQTVLPYLVMALEEVIYTANEEDKKTAILYSSIIPMINFSENINRDELEKLAERAESWRNRYGITESDLTNFIQQKTSQEVVSESGESSLALPAEAAEDQVAEDEFDEAEDVYESQSNHVSSSSNDDSAEGSAGSSVRREIKRAAKKLGKGRISFDQLQKIMTSIGVDTSKSHRPHGGRGRDIEGQMRNRINSAVQAIRAAHGRGDFNDEEVALLLG